jgi:hypothetical protein
METTLTPQEGSVRSTPRDAFMHLLLIITLYMSVMSFVVLLFNYIDLLLPDPLNTYYRSAYDGIRWASSVLVVAFPVYLYLSWRLNKDFVTVPAKRELKVRKWLIHLTLFLAAVIIIGDLITLIYNFYGGDLTTRFLLKILVVLAVAAGVFWYYLRDLKGNVTATVQTQAAWLTGAVMIVALVAGFFIGGSPAYQRQVRFDEQRISDLQTIQSQIVNYWQQKESLPESLDQLSDDISGFAPPTDPATGQPYEYRVTGASSFELCATFAQNNQAQVPATRPLPVRGEPENWDHEAGQTCFSRAIDPDLYPPIPKERPVD